MTETILGKDSEPIEYIVLNEPQMLDVGGAGRMDLSTTKSASFLKKCSWNPKSKRWMWRGEKSTANITQNGIFIMRAINSFYGSQLIREFDCVKFNKFERIAIRFFPELDMEKTFENLPKNLKSSRIKIKFYKKHITVKYAETFYLLRRNYFTLTKSEKRNLQKETEWFANFIKKYGVKDVRSTNR